MKWLNGLRARFGSGNRATFSAGNQSEQAVLIDLDGMHLPDDVYQNCDLFTLEGLIEGRLQVTGTGKLDGHETGPETTTIYLYGPDAEAIYSAIETVLTDYPLSQNSSVTIRYGAPQAAFRTVRIPGAES